MNRLVTSNPEAVAPEQLPPRERERAARILFINSNVLGLARMAAQVREYTALREDVDAVHVEMVRPLWVKAVGKTFRAVPHGWDLAAYRQLVVYRGIVRRWLNGPLA